MRFHQSLGVSCSAYPGDYEKIRVLTDRTIAIRLDSPSSGIRYLLSNVNICVRFLGFKILAFATGGRAKVTRESSQYLDYLFSALHSQLQSRWQRLNIE